MSNMLRGKNKKPYRAFTALAHSARSRQSLRVVYESEDVCCKFEGEVLEEISLEERCDLGVNEEQFGG